MKELLFIKHFSRLGLFSLGKRSEEFLWRDKPGTVDPCSPQCKVGSLKHLLSPSGPVNNSLALSGNTLLAGRRGCVGTQVLTNGFGKN